MRIPTLGSPCGCFPCSSIRIQSEVERHLMSRSGIGSRSWNLNSQGSFLLFDDILYGHTFQICVERMKRKVYGLLVMYPKELNPAGAVDAPVASLLAFLRSGRHAT